MEHFAPVAGQVRETFVAALASTPAAEAVGSGQLTRALSYAGFGDVDLSEATAAPSPARRPALRVIAGGGEGAKRSGAGKAARTPRRNEPDEPEVDDEPDVADEADEPEEEPAPDPQAARTAQGGREALPRDDAAAARTGDALGEATDALEALDARIAELDAALKEAPVPSGRVSPPPARTPPRRTRRPSAPSGPRSPRSTNPPAPAARRRRLTLTHPVPTAHPRTCEPRRRP